MEDLFEGFDPSRYEDAARHRWGTSEPFVESEKRTGATRLMIGRRLRPNKQRSSTMRIRACRGQPPSDEAVMDIAERHRRSIDRWFYPCSHSMHSGLASMYESDDRFRQSIDSHGEGLTPFLAEAIRANAARHQD